MEMEKFVVSRGSILNSSIKTVQGSEKVLGKWVTATSGNRTLQDGLAKHLSILSSMRAEIGLRLVHVYLGLGLRRSWFLILSNHWPNTVTAVFLLMSQSSTTKAKCGDPFIQHLLH